MIKTIITIMLNILSITNSSSQTEKISETKKTQPIFRLLFESLNNNMLFCDDNMPVTCYRKIRI